MSKIDAIRELLKPHPKADEKTVNQMVERLERYGRDVQGIVNVRPTAEGEKTPDLQPSI